MPETRLAHFRRHWEAELARGYLEDAGVPSRLVSDNLAGGHAYMGGAAGASLFVAPAQLGEARRVLEAAGVLDAGAGGPGSERAHADGDEQASPPGTAHSPLAEADRADLMERLAKARKDEVRHFIRCMLGVTPTAAIPIVGLALEGEVALLALLCVLVVFVEGWRWIRSGREARRLEGALQLLDGRGARGPAEGSA